MAHNTSFAISQTPHKRKNRLIRPYHIDQVKTNGNHNNRGKTNAQAP